MSNYAVGKMARRVELPLRCGGSLIASKVEGAQATHESADSILSTILASANYVFHALGWMEGDLYVGFEKLMMDAYRLSSYQLHPGGLEVNHNSLADDAYEEMDPGGYFLGSAHTMRNYKTAFYKPALSDSENFESWEEKDSNATRARA